MDYLQKKESERMKWEYIHSPRLRAEGQTVALGRDPGGRRYWFDCWKVVSGEGRGRSRTLRRARVRRAPKSRDRVSETLLLWRLCRHQQRH
jgi:hypothetical protein